MKALLLMILFVSANVFADNYNFTVSTYDDADSSCSQAQTVKNDFLSKPQQIIVQTSYNTTTEMGTLNINDNIIGLSATLYPDGIENRSSFTSDMQSASIVVNGHEYWVDRIIFNAYNPNENTWGTDSKTLIGLEISTPGHPEDICFVTNRNA